MCTTQYNICIMFGDGLNENGPYRFRVFEYIAPVGDTVEIEKVQPCWRKLIIVSGLCEFGSLWFLHMLVDMSSQLSAQTVSCCAFFAMLDFLWNHHCSS